MFKRKFGNTGEQVSILGFGTAPIGIPNYKNTGYLDEKHSIETIIEAVNCGVNYFDTAPVYGKEVHVNGWNSDRTSERLLGIALQNVPRDKVFIATKNMFDRTEPEAIRDSLEESLRLLKTDYVDLLQIHGYYKRPYRADNWREFVTDDMIEVVQSLQKEGKCRYLGISGWREGGVCAAMESGVFQSVMPLFNFLNRGAEYELVNIAKERGIAIVPMRPLTGTELPNLLKQFHKTVQDCIDPYKLCMEYLLNFDSVSTLPVGMCSISELHHNVEIIEEIEAAIIKSKESEK